MWKLIRIIQLTFVHQEPISWREPTAYEYSLR
jgi:hypothetical protein